MKLLLDANISWRLCSFITEKICDCEHVNRVIIPLPADDLSIWKYAKDHGFTIITQDSDFLNFLETKGYPPKLILLKTGSINKEQMKEVLLQAKQAIIEFHNKQEYGLLEIS